MNYRAQREWVERLLLDFTEFNCFIAGASGSVDERNAASADNERCRAAFEKLFPHSDDGAEQSSVPATETIERIATIAARKAVAEFLDGPLKTASDPLKSSDVDLEKE